MKQGKFLRIFVVVENVGERFFWQNGGDEGEGSGLLIGDYLDLAAERQREEGARMIWRIWRMIWQREKDCEMK